MGGMITDALTTYYGCEKYVVTRMWDMCYFHPFVQVEHFKDNMICMDINKCIVSKHKFDAEQMLVDIKTMMCGDNYLLDMLWFVYTHHNDVSYSLKHWENNKIRITFYADDKEYWAIMDADFDLKEAIKIYKPKERTWENW